MKKLAIVSSYNEMCGNATYAEALRQEFSKYYQVEVLALDVGLLNKSNKQIEHLADKHIEELSEKLKEFDCVNIQFEIGLFGVHPKQVFRRVEKLIKNSKNLIFTMHRLDLKVSLFDRTVLRYLARLQIKKFLKSSVMMIRKNYYSCVYEKVIKICKKRNAAILVHTKRDRTLIKRHFDYERVYDHPISFLTKEKLQSYQQKANRSQFVKRYALQEDDVLIGIFGFISSYKGHHFAIKAMKYLPQNYKLLIFGSQHPGSIQDSEVDSYLHDLLAIIEHERKEKRYFYEEISGDSITDIKNIKVTHTKNKLENTPCFSERIKFCGALGDDEFINALLCCDLTVLPYLETSQGGSGIAALTLETGGKSLFSQNYAFLELKKYAPGCIKMFGIGNHLELAECIRNYGEKPTQALENYFTKYNLETNIAMHRKLFEEGETQ